MLVSGFVQAGGQSQRMGQNKARILLQGRPMISYSLAVLARVAEQIGIVVGQSLADYADYQAATIALYPDIWPGCGPLGGIGTALAHSRHDYVINLACDMPLIDQELLELLINQAAGYQVCVPCDAQGQLQPLCAVYHRSCQPYIAQLMAAQQFAPRRLFDQVRTRVVPFSLISQLSKGEHCFMNVNTINELAAVTTLLMTNAVPD